MSLAEKMQGAQWLTPVQLAKCSTSESNTIRPQRKRKQGRRIFVGTESGYPLNTPALPAIVLGCQICLSCCGAAAGAAFDRTSPGDPPTECRRYALGSRGGERCRRRACRLLRLELGIW